VSRASRRAIFASVALGAAALAGVVGIAPGASAAPARSARAARAAVPTIANPIAFTDNFDNGRTDGWSAVTEGHTDGPAHWRATGGRLYQSSNVYGGTLSPSSLERPGTDFLAGSPGWTNVDFSVREKTWDDDEMGVVFRYQDRNNYYRFAMDRQHHYRRLVRKVNGQDTLLAQSSIGYATGTWYGMRVVAVGSDIRVLVNGTQIFHVTDASVKSGRIGIFDWGTPLFADDVQVSAEDDSYFTVAVLPDTQFESKFAPAMFDAQTQWLSAHRANENLAVVLHEGDVINDMVDPQQWKNAETALDYLGGKVPYVVAAGNHDIMDGTHYHFPVPVMPTDFNAMVGRLTDYRFTGRYAGDDYRDTYRLLSAGGVDLLVLNLTFGAPDDVLAWAAKIVDRYPTRHVLLLTHDYLGQNNQVRGLPGDRNLPSQVNPVLNDGTAIWAKFISQHPNVQFTFNGHVINHPGDPFLWTVGRLVTPDLAGRPVYQTLTNYQGTADGDGYLRLFRFYPATGRVRVLTYSPYLNQSLTDSFNRFSYTGVDLGTWTTAP
jgi:hypothetical protein